MALYDAQVVTSGGILNLRSEPRVAKATDIGDVPNGELLQVLEEMNGYPTGRAATAEFSRAASAVLTRRVSNAPAARGEKRWLAGWLNRCKTYR